MFWLIGSFAFVFGAWFGLLVAALCSAAKQGDRMHGAE